MRTGEPLDTPPEVVKLQALAEESRPEVPSVDALTDNAREKERPTVAKAMMDLSDNVRKEMANVQNLEEPTTNRLSVSESPRQPATPAPRTFSPVDGDELKSPTSTRVDGAMPGTIRDALPLAQAHAKALLPVDVLADMTVQDRKVEDTSASSAEKTQTVGVDDDVFDKTTLRPSVKKVPTWREIDEFLDDSPNGFSPEDPLTEISHDSDTEIVSAWNKRPWSPTSSEKGELSFKRSKITCDEFVKCLCSDPKRGCYPHSLLGQ
jgi:hypothetical protein